LPTATRVRRHRTRQVVTHRHCGPLGHQHEGGGLADDLGVPHHHHLEAMQLKPGGFDQLHRRSRCAGRQGQIVVDDVADRGGIHALDILERVDRGGERPAVNVRRHRALQDHAEHVGIVVHRDDARLAFLLGQRVRPDLFLEAETDPLRGGRLATHINRRGLLLANADGHETPNRMTCRRLPHALGDLVENTVAHEPAVQKPVVLHTPFICSQTLQRLLKHDRTAKFRSLAEIARGERRTRLRS
jgi:hypothetical protein